MLKDKNAIITGCAGGIGKSILELFAQNGANVWACIRKPDDIFLNYIDKLSTECNVRITPLYFDFNDSEQMKTAVKTIILSKQKIDILVNNAGITYNALFQMTTIDKLKDIFEVNFFSQVMFTQYIIKFMVRQNSGSIINISSSAAIDGNSGRSAYGASKAALICVTKAISEEFGRYNIRANAIAPGITDTGMVAASMTNEVIQETINETCMKRIGKPNEIAKVALFLASDMSSYVTGQVVRVDGGM